MSTREVFGGFKYAAKFVRSFILSMLCFTSMPAFSQSSTSELQLKAAFIYNFTRFIDWPPRAYTSPDAPFIIGVMGDGGLAKRINEVVKGESVGNHDISARNFDKVGDVGHCNILYIGGDEFIEVRRMLPDLNRRGILTVSDVSGFEKWGGIVRFFKEDSKLRLQINIDQAKAADLTISSKLMSLSKIYSGK